MANGNDMQWAKTADAGDYLATYDGDEATDAGSRCGRSDSALDEIKRILRGRGMQLVADDRGLLAEADGGDANEDPIVAFARRSVDADRKACALAGTKMDDVWTGEHTTALAAHLGRKPTEDEIDHATNVYAEASAS